MAEFNDNRYKFLLNELIQGVTKLTASFELIATKLIQVQPLPMPSGNIFYTNFTNPLAGFDLLKEAAQMKEHERAVLMAAMFESGLLPIEAGEAGLDMRRVLAQLPPEEAHKMKRKFRKVWRKLAAKAAPDERRMKFHYGAGEKQPSRNARRNRKELVHSHFLKNVVAPIIAKFETGTRPSDDQEPTKS